jgi:hypothetical protein
MAGAGAQAGPATVRAARAGGGRQRGRRAQRRAPSGGRGRQPRRSAWAGPRAWAPRRRPPAPASAHRGQAALRLPGLKVGGLCAGRAARAVRGGRPGRRARAPKRLPGRRRVVTNQGWGTKRRMAWGDGGISAPQRAGLKGLSGGVDSECVAMRRAGGSGHREPLWAARPAPLWGAAGQAGRRACGRASRQQSGVGVPGGELRMQAGDSRAPAARRGTGTARQGLFQGRFRWHRRRGRLAGAGAAQQTAQRRRPCGAALSFDAWRGRAARRGGGGARGAGGQIREGGQDGPRGRLGTGLSAAPRPCAHFPRAKAPGVGLRGPSVLREGGQGFWGAAPSIADRQERRGQGGAWHSRRAPSAGLGPREKRARERKRVWKASAGRGRQGARAVAAGRRAGMGAAAAVAGPSAGQGERDSA